MSESIAPAKPSKAPDLPRGYVLARITKLGENKVATGEHTIETGYTFYRRDEMVPLPDAVARDLEARGFAEVQD